MGRSPDGEHQTAKLLSDSAEQYSDAAIEGIRRMLALESGEPIPSDRIESVKMGTTVATNALLERKGARTALLINRGFADVLRIGTQQRPRLFDLQIVLPEQVYERVIEFEGRFSVEGEEIEPLRLEPVRRSLESLLAEGIRSLAIVGIHGYRYPQHERLLADLARNSGFDQVSSQPRSQPTHQVNQSRRHDRCGCLPFAGSGEIRRWRPRPPFLECACFLCSRTEGWRMQVVSRERMRFYRVRQAGLSGRQRSVLQSGFERIIAFDMGGTSTDVTHFAGEFERRLETEVAGVRICAPMMHIHTVAAGGGSICRFDGSRLRVGPESAGANPGPACYRRERPAHGHRLQRDARTLAGRFFSENLRPNR